MLRLNSTLALLLMLGTGCSDTSDKSDRNTRDAAQPLPDSGKPDGALPEEDELDSGARDSGQTDSGQTDSGPSVGNTPDADIPDGAIPDAGTPPAAFTASENAWAALVAENGGTYWYRVSSCGQGYREITWVQITEGVGTTTVWRETEENADCVRGEPYIYEGFNARALEGLYDECYLRVQRVGLEEANFEVDAEGIVRSCWDTAPNCADACDDGFFITDRGFGVGDRDAGVN
jgi:hypothetical protein